MKNNAFLKTLLLVSLASMVGSSNAQTISEGTCTISRTFYKNDGTPLQGVRVIVTKVVKNSRIISRGPVTYLSDASGAVSFTVPQGSKVYMDPSGFNTSDGVPVSIPDSSGWTYTLDSPQPLGSMRAAELIVQRNDITVVDTLDTLDFSTTFNVSESPDHEANISINHDSLKARPGSKLNYLHNLFVDRALSAHDETSLANAHTKALDSNFVLLIPPDYSAAAMTFTNRDSALRLINYATINITENDTVPVGASIVMAGKGAFQISSGKTLTFASGSRFDGGLQRRFIGSGTVKFQEDVVEAVYPQWWGAVGDSSTQSASAFQKAVDSGKKRITVKVPCGAYFFNDKIQIPSNVDLIGDKARIYSSDTTDFIFHVTPSKKNIRISGFELKYILRAKVRASDISAMFINECDTLEIDHNIIRNAPGMGIEMTAVRVAKIHHNHVEYANADGIHVRNGTNTDTGRNLRSENVIVTDNTVINVGDDHIAVVSYERPFRAGHDSCGTHIGCPPWTGSQLICRNIVIANNVVEGSNELLATIVAGTAKTRGITVLGGEKVVIDGNTVKGQPTGSGSVPGSMTRGIMVSNSPTFWAYRPVDVVISNNIIIDAGDIPNASEHAGIELSGVDSVLVIGNKINWSGAASAIRIRGLTINENFGATPPYNNSNKNIKITGNTIQDAFTALTLVTSSINQNENIIFSENFITNTRRNWINIDSTGSAPNAAKNVYVLNNIFNTCNTDSNTSVSAMRFEAVDYDLVVRGNVMRSPGNDHPTRYAIEVTAPKDSINFIEKDNTFDMKFNAGFTRLSFPSSMNKYAVQNHYRVHYMNLGSTAPTAGKWNKGDIIINQDPDNGDVAHWICTASGTPGTWVQGLAGISGITLRDTVRFVPNASGVVSGVLEQRSTQLPVLTLRPAILGKSLWYDHETQAVIWSSVIRASLAAWCVTERSEIQTTHWL
jgi:hypothetical protein